MKNAEITAFTYGELKLNWNMYKAAIDKLFAYVRRSGKFSPKEWYNCIIC